MATVFIYGRECNFQGIPAPILEQYGPCHSTHICYYRASRPEDSLFLLAWLHMMERLQLIDRLKQIDLGGDTIIHLFDYMSDSRSLADLEKYGSALCGTNFLVVCPWRVAVFGDAENHLRTIGSVIDAAIEHEKRTGKKLNLPPEFTKAIHDDEQRTAKILELNRGNHV